MAYSMNPFHDRLTKPNYPNKIKNPLHKFASYNCLFTLSGLTEAEIRDQKKYLTGRVQDISLIHISETTRHEEIS